MSDETSPMRTPTSDLSLPSNHLKKEKLLPQLAIIQQEPVSQQQQQIKYFFFILINDSDTIKFSLGKEKSLSLLVIVKIKQS